MNERWTVAGSLSAACAASLCCTPLQEERLPRPARVSPVEPTRGRQPEEGWREYAQRTYDETAAALRRLLETIDITTEGLNSFDFLRAKARDGVNLLAHMVFVCYFVASDAPNT